MDGGGDRERVGGRERRGAGERREERWRGMSVKPCFGVPCVCKPKVCVCVQQRCKEVEGGVRDRE